MHFTESAKNYINDRCIFFNKIYKSKYYFKIYAIGFQKDIAGKVGGNPGVLYITSFDDKIKDKEFIVKADVSDIEYLTDLETHVYMQNASIDFVDGNFKIIDPKITNFLWNY